jgi:hypothetical protein
MFRGRSTRAIVVGGRATFTERRVDASADGQHASEPLQRNPRSVKRRQLGSPRRSTATSAARAVDLISKRPVIASISGHPLHVPFVNRADRIDVKIGYLECLVVLYAIDDTPTDLEIPRPFALPAPLLQRATGDAPPFGQPVLIQMPHDPIPLPGSAPQCARARETTLRNLSLRILEVCGQGGGEA